MKGYPSHQAVERLCLNADGKWRPNPLLFSGAKHRCDVTPVQAANLYRKTTIDPELCDTLIPLDSVRKDIAGFKKRFPTLSGQQ